jgi:hypothetical protein
MAESTLSRRAFVGVSLGALAELALGCGDTRRARRGHLPNGHGPEDLGGLSDRRERQSHAHDRRAQPPAVEAIKHSLRDA